MRALLQRLSVWLITMVAVALFWSAALGVEVSAVTSMSPWQDDDPINDSLKDAPFLPESSKDILKRAFDKSQPPSGADVSIFGAKMVRIGVIALTEDELKELMTTWDAAFKGLPEAEQNNVLAYKAKIQAKQPLTAEEKEALRQSTKNALLTLPSERLSRLQEINFKALKIAILARWPDFVFDTPQTP